MGVEVGVGGGRRVMLQSDAAGVKTSHAPRTPPPAAPPFTAGLISKKGRPANGGDGVVLHADGRCTADCCDDSIIGTGTQVQNQLQTHQKHFGEDGEVLSQYQILVQTAVAGRSTLQAKSGGLLLQYHTRVNQVR